MEEWECIFFKSHVSEAEYSKIHNEKFLSGSQKFEQFIKFFINSFLPLR